MKIAKQVACTVGTAVVWGAAVCMVFGGDLLVAPVVMDAALAVLVLLCSSLSTVAIWWCPRCLVGTAASAAEAPRHESESPISAPVAFSSTAIARASVWWRLAFAAAITVVATLPVWMGMHLGKFPKWIPIPFSVPINAAMAVPAVYLLAFSLWHWRTRYAGSHHLAWPILFALMAWPIWGALPGTALMGLTYFILHAIPDCRHKGKYAAPTPLVVVAPATPPPAGYQLIRSACFVVGWTLVIGGLLAAALSCAVHFHIWNEFETKLPRQIGKPFTQSLSDVMWVCSRVGKISVVACLLSSAASALGAVLIQVSQRIRWRLLDERRLPEQTGCLRPEAAP